MSEENVFEKLEQYDSIIAYTSENHIPNKFIQFCEPNNINIDLFQEELKNAFIAHYNIKKLPCMIIEKINIYDDSDFENNLKIAKEKMEVKLFKRLDFMINNSQNFLFIKGTPSRPECGFTRQLIDLLDKYDLEYDYFNIFEDESVREGLKKKNEWYTYPMIYLNKKFMGGLDVLKEMEKDGSLGKILKKK